MESTRGCHAALERLHVGVFVYGSCYLDRFRRIVLPNLACLVEELSEQLRAGTRFHILTDDAGKKVLAEAAALDRIGRRVSVEITDDMDDPQAARDDKYLPMRLGQGRLVREASAEGAGIVFCPPDLIWSRGSFGKIEQLASCGVRAIIGPSARVVDETLEPQLEARIARDVHGGLDIPANEMIDLLFAHWQHMNDGFFWNAPASYAWKSYAYYRLDDRHFLMKFFQGPAMFLWPRAPVPDYTDFVDHRLIRKCVTSLAEIHVIGDARDMMTLDITSRDRCENHRLVSHPGIALFWQFLNRKRHSRYNLLAGRYDCRVYDTPLPEATWQEAERRFDREIMPVIYLAIALRPVVAVGSGLLGRLGIRSAIGRLAVWIRGRPAVRAVAAKAKRKVASILQF